MRKLLIVLLGTLPVLLFNCGNDDDGPNTNENCIVNYSMDLSTAGTAYSDAAIAYTNDQSASNCQAWRDAAQGLLDVINQYSNCNGINQADYQQDLQEAQANISSISC
ncbi:MAG: hypothetical protein AAF433_10020 [Bacteroidota bacterium]